MALWSMVKIAHFWLFLRAPGTQGELSTGGEEFSLLVTQNITTIGSDILDIWL